MRPGYNPARRNRNIGTAKQGHGQDNRLVIPDQYRDDSRRWGETLKPYQIYRHTMAGRTITFIVEATYPGFVHPCSVSDVAQVLRHVPNEDWKGLDTFLFRQPTRKQRVLSPVWGRMFYSADLGLPNRSAVSQGPTVILEAAMPGDSYKLSASLGPDDVQEFERLKIDDHDIRRESKGFVVKTSPSAVRATQLYRTLLHEIGHWNDYLTKVEIPREPDFERWEELNELYFARPKHEREAYAHRYADNMRGELEKLGVIPFDPLG